MGCVTGWSPSASLPSCCSGPSFDEEGSGLVPLVPGWLGDGTADESADFADDTTDVGVSARWAATETVATFLLWCGSTWRPGMLQLPLIDWNSFTCDGRGGGHVAGEEKATKHATLGSLTSLCWKPHAVQG